MARPEQHVGLRAEAVAVRPKVVRPVHLSRPTPQQEVERSPAVALQVLGLNVFG